jgi:DNA-binding transcriptional MerR regulator
MFGGYFMYYTVSEIAKKMDVNASTLRYYDKEGLLPFVERSRGGIRMFKESDIGMLDIIGCLKQTGMSIKDIKSFVDYYKTGDTDFANRIKILDNQKASVLEQMESLQHNLDMLEYKKWYYQKAIELKSLSEVANLPVTDVPKKFHKFLIIE